MENRTWKITPKDAAGKILKGKDWFVGFEVESQVG
jgi:hypothetical protein